MVQATSAKITPFPQVYSENLGFDPSQPAAISASSVELPATPQDKVEITTTDKTEKKGPIRSIKDFVRTIKKFNIDFIEYAKGALVGIGSGILSGAAVFGGATLANKVKELKHNSLIKKNLKIAEENIKITAENAARLAKDEAAELLKMVPELSVKKLRKIPAKPIAIGVGIGALIAKLWTASLDANQKKADVDHRWTTTPVSSK